jgi:hypothetical protein
MTVHIGTSRVGVSTLILLAALFLAVPPPAAPQIVGRPQDRVKVIGHLALPGMQVNHIFLQQMGENVYLYLHLPAKQAFALVDVTRPDKPVLLVGETLKESPGAQVEMVKSEAMLAVSVSPDGPAGGSGAPQAAGAAPEIKLPTQTVRLIDLSDPRNPKTIKTFSGVTSMAADDPHRLLFIVNGEGLWVVIHREVHLIPPCDTAAALMIQANCQ